MEGALAKLGCRGCRRQFLFRFDEARLDGHKLAFVCPKCGRARAIRVGPKNARSDASDASDVESPESVSRSSLGTELTAPYRFADIVESEGAQNLGRLLRRELRLGMVAALAGSNDMEVAEEMAAGRTINRRYYLAAVARDSGAPFWNQLIGLGTRDERLALFRRQYEGALGLLEKPRIYVEDEEALLGETMQVILAGELLAHTPLADQAEQFGAALCAHALAREIFWAAYLEDSLSVSEVGEIFAQAHSSQERVRDLEADFADLRRVAEARSRSLLSADPDAAVELRERLKGESEDLPPDALVYEPD